MDSPQSPATVKTIPSPEAVVSGLGSGNKRYRIVLPLILLFFTVLTVYAVLRDADRIPMYDETSYLNEALHAHGKMKRWDFDFLLRYEGNTPGKKPPLVPAAMAVSYLVFGPSMKSAVLANIPFMLLLLVSVYGIGKTLFDEKTGLLAAFMVITFPVLNYFSRLVFIDFAYTALISFSVYALLKTASFANRKASLLFGVTLGLTALANWSFLVYLTAPLIFVLIAREKRHLKRSVQLTNLALALGCFLLLAVPWYRSAAGTVLLSFEKYYWGQRGLDTLNSLNHGSYTEFLTSLRCGSYYFFSLFTCLASGFMIIPLFTLSSPLFRASRKKGNKRGVAFLSTAFLVPFVAISLLPFREVRFLFPALPVLAVLLASLVFRFPGRSVTRVMLLLVVTIGLCHTGISVCQKKYYLYKAYLGDSSRKYDFYSADDFKIHDILDLIVEDGKSEKGKQIVIESSPGYHYTRPEIFVYHGFTRYGRKIAMQGFSWKWTFDNTIDLKEELLQVDYLLLTRPHLGLHEKEWDIVDQEIEKGVDEYENFELIGAFEMPDGREPVRVYKNRLEDPRT